jgi:hypothetical protein
MIPMPICPEALAMISKTPLVTEALPEPELSEKFDALIAHNKELELKIEAMKHFADHKEKRVRELIAERDYYADRYERLRDNLVGVLKGKV